MDIEYLLFLQRIREAIGEPLSAVAIHLSDTIILIAMPVLLFLFWSYKKQYGTFGLMAYGISYLFVSFLKQTFCVYRPWWRDARVVPSPMAKVLATGYSFPSGHSVSAGCMFGTLGWIWRGKRAVVVLCGLMILLAMFLRNLIGVHTPQDVIVGCLSGLASVLAACLLTRWEAGGKNRDLIVLAVAFAVYVAVLAYFSLKSYPMDYVDGKLLVDPKKMAEDGWKDMGAMIGIFAGLSLEKRLVRFADATTWTARILRFVPGIVLFFLLDSLLKSVLIRLLGASVGKSLASICLYVFCIVVYPLIFQAVEKYLAARREKVQVQQ